MKEPTEFEQKVYDVTTRISPGRVATYGQIAQALGQPGAARAVGNALNKNPFAPRVPCHRVVKSTGELGGFASGCTKKEDLLKREGVEIKNGRVVDFERKLTGRLL
jgi:O-6-methylguanine DNA methyltransferase